MQMLCRMVLGVGQSEAPFGLVKMTHVRRGVAGLLGAGGRHSTCHSECKRDRLDTCRSDGERDRLAPGVLGDVGAQAYVLQAGIMGTQVVSSHCCSSDLVTCKS